MYICLIRAHPHKRFGEFVQPRQKPWNVSLVGLHKLASLPDNETQWSTQADWCAPNDFFPRKTIALKSKYCLEISEARKKAKNVWTTFSEVVFSTFCYHDIAIIVGKKRFPENLGIKKNCTLETFGHWVPLLSVMRIVITNSSQKKGHHRHIVKAL